MIGAGWSPGYSTNVLGKQRKIGQALGPHSLMGHQAEVPGFCMARLQLLQISGEGTSRWREEQSPPSFSLFSLSPSSMELCLSIRLNTSFSKEWWKKLPSNAIQNQCAILALFFSFTALPWHLRLFGAWIGEMGWANQILTYLKTFIHLPISSSPHREQPEDRRSLERFQNILAFTKGIESSHKIE